MLATRLASLVAGDPAKIRTPYRSAPLRFVGCTAIAREEGHGGLALFAVEHGLLEG